MKVVIKGRYILNAAWHAQHGKEVEIVMKRKGKSKAYKGEDIYHVAFDPDESFRAEDLDEEFIIDNFKPTEELVCLLDITEAPKDIIKKFKPYYKLLQSKLGERINATFEVRDIGDAPAIQEDYLCIFYLLDDGTGKPCLTLDKEHGELLIIDEEKGTVIEKETE